MEEEVKAPLDGKYLMYKGKPLVRSGNLITYGDMIDKCYLSIMVLQTEKDENGAEYPNSILLQILDSKTQQIVDQKQKFFTGKDSLYSALDLGIVWLSRYTS